MRLHVPAMLLLASLSLPVAAQETRPMPEDYTPPSATLSQFDWMVGQWEGAGVGGNLALESWLAPTGDTMVGTFVQTAGDGNIQFSEHMYLMEEEGSVVLRLKHFNADLTGWEERDDMTSFRLLSVEHCAAHFGGLTIRCTDEGGLLVAVRMRSSSGEPSELVFDYDRARSPSPTACPDAETTADMNYCYSQLTQAAEGRRSRYYGEARARFADNPQLLERLAEAETAFLTYADAECAAIYWRWSGGTIRDVMTYTCRIRQADRRAHELWSNWLTYPDSTPPILPEPAPTI